jgi:O-antigen/teichoic acid export membrane protein
MPELQSLAMWALPFSLLQGAGRFAESVQVSRRDFRCILLANVLNGGMQLILVGVCFLKNEDPSLAQLLGFQSVGFAAGLLAYFVFGKKYFRFGRFEKQKLSALYRFGRYVAGTNFFSLLFQRLDTLLIGVFLTPAALAVYNVATRLNGLLDLPLNGMSLAQFPLIAKAHADGRPVLGAFNHTVRQLVLVQLPLSLLLVLAAPWAVVLLAGENYASAAPLLQILAIAGLAKPWGRAFGMTLDAAGRADLNFKMLLFSMVVNLVLNLSLMPLFGVTGAALATGLGIVLTVLAGQVLLTRSGASLRRGFDAAQAGT